MKASLKPGVSRTERVTVGDDRTIHFLGDDLRIYSTPAMVNDVEYAVYRMILEHLEEGESSLGIHVEVEHYKATPLGEDVTVRVTVADIDGRKVRADAEVRDALDVIGRGTHTRYVIDVARYEEQAKEKFARLAALGAKQ